MTVGLLASIVSIQLLVLATGAQSATTLLFLNNCKYSVWPGLYSNDGSISPTGFALAPSDYITVAAPAGWSGRIWGRTGCDADSKTNALTCGTGDCGTGALECSGKYAALPATMVEFKLDGDGGFDYYAVSLLGGFNLPVQVRPEVSPGNDGGIGKCFAAECFVDLNGRCPLELSVFVSRNSDDVMACKSACLAFHKDEDCCTGENGSPEACPQTSYTKLFKDACPTAFSTRFDDRVNTFACASGTNKYHITFCPPPGSPGGASERSAAAPRITPSWFQL